MIALLLIVFSGLMYYGILETINKYKDDEDA